MNPLTPSLGLTFDDGPDPVWTPRVLAALRESGAKATFFVCAPAAAQEPGLIDLIRADGHGVGFHCNRHVRHSQMTPEEIGADAEIGLAVLDGLGVRPRLWRTPWGDLAPATLDVARRFGLVIQHWTEDTHDWRGDSAEAMIAAIGPSVRPGSVVLMHDGLGPGALRDGCAETVALIGPLVDLGQGRGLEARALDEPARADIGDVLVGASRVGAS